MKKTIKNNLITAVLSVTVLVCCVGCRNETASVSEYEYLKGGLAWQLSAESQALILQAFDTAKSNIADIVEKCKDPGESDWVFTYAEDGSVRMEYNGVRAAIICDIDDTLVDGAHYSANIVGKNGDYNNVAFARFVMSDRCTALPGAVDFVNYCIENGIEVYYVTNRYDQGYKIGQSDSRGSYKTSIAEAGKGLYTDKSGKEIGCTIYQALGKSFYDISLESMQRLRFPVDDQHLILNDLKLNGESKEPIRTAVREGSEAYQNGQRRDGNSTGSASSVAMEPHHIVMLLGDNIGDFTDDFSNKELNAVSRAELVQKYSGKWGSEWIMFPNSVYGASLNYAQSYGFSELFDFYDYTRQK